jgi:hypothetical protein
LERTYRRTNGGYEGGLGPRCYASRMGIMKTLTSWLKGADQDVEAEPPPTTSRPPREAVEAAAPVPSLEPQASPVPPYVVVDKWGLEPEQEPRPKAAGVKKVMLDEAAVSILDLRELPSSPFRIVGSAYWVTDSGRYEHGGTEYLLVREPKNKWDANAVAVYGKGRKVGHLTEAKAAALAPIFDELGYGAYWVGGTGPAPNSMRMWVDLPALPKLRAFAKTIGKSA